MSSRRRSPDRRKEGLHSSSSRAAAASSRLRMDRNPTHSRITDPSEPAGRRREIDNVMKKARASPNANGYWDKKLLEVEEKDPNRWRHTGYKALYIEGSSPSPSPSRRNGGSSPPPRRNGGSVRRSRSRSRQRRTPPAPSASTSSRPRPRSPPPPRSARSISASSLSSCSDDSCSVCSPKHRGHKTARSRSRSFSVPRSRSHKVNSASASNNSNNRVKSGQVSGQRPRPRGPTSPPPQSPSPHSSRARPIKTKPSTSSGSVRRPPPSNHMSQRSHIAEASPTPRARNQMPLPIQEIIPPPSRAHDKNRRPKESKRPKVAQIRIKKEKKSNKPRRLSPTVAESSGSDESSSCSDAPPVVAATRLTLSERFGKMAQWSVDRRDIENMRITKNSSGGDLKVMIEEDDIVYGDPPPRYSHSPAPQGHYPDELLTVGPSGLASWDDVRVRYQYYKERGYLRDLTLDDYIKWEEWWYKYQEWLKAERYYELWVQQRQQQRNRRRKRLPATQRLN
ncbi:serine/arginine repetitive matrix protein 1 isoform X2 [Chrysoperla carnea]|uniref:serine/arginine repetitive matrix protein 1 isoform X2 n=1 Tax=Chrysoperla carnea TaxID=189513 RepID=UPI001D086656|nr:serine/arginine repetitive matrix protein 1 isoform X2 [Chrysoperla carnea]